MDVNSFGLRVFFGVLLIVGSCSGGSTPPINRPDAGAVDSPTSDLASAADDAGSNISTEGGGTGDSNLQGDTGESTTIATFFVSDSLNNAVYRFHVTPEADPIMTATLSPGFQPAGIGIAPTGELFAAMREHSVLVGKHGSVETGIHAAAFKDGLASFNAFPHAQLLHRLFECRSRQLSGELRAPTAYLSGFLIASDVHGALRVLSSSIETRLVYVIGSCDLTQLYATTLADHAYEAVQVEGTAASRAGLAQVHQRLSQGGGT